MYVVDENDIMRICPKFKDKCQEWVHKWVLARYESKEPIPYSKFLQETFNLTGMYTGHVYYIHFKSEEEYMMFILKWS